MTFGKTLRELLQPCAVANPLLADMPAQRYSRARPTWKPLGRSLSSQPTSRRIIGRNIHQELGKCPERIAGDSADVVSSVAETSTSMDGAVISAAEASDGILETVLEGVLPVTVGAKLAHNTWQSTADMDTGERIAVTSAAGGLGVLGTMLVVSNPIGATCVAAYGTYKLVKLGANLWDRYAVE